MTTTQTERPTGARPTVLCAGTTTLSALVSRPETTHPRATVVAIPGTGMRAGYFDGQTLPSTSLLALGAQLGFTVVALDRPGYGLSSERWPNGQSLADQTTTVRAALATFAAENPVGAGIFLLGHSLGGMVALSVAAASGGGGVLAVDVSGCGHHYAPGAWRSAGRTHRCWGPLSLYPPNTFRSSSGLVASTPRADILAAWSWPRRFRSIAERLTVPVRFTFAEHEQIWRHDRQALGELTTRLAHAERVVVDEQPHAGHNISLGWAARSYHLRCFGFIEECLLNKEVTG
ncbi:alpha/beta hydrolase [Nocardia sp. NPDC055053]